MVGLTGYRLSTQHHHHPFHTPRRAVSSPPTGDARYAYTFTLFTPARTTHTYLCTACSLSSLSLCIFVAPYMPRV